MKKITLMLLMMMPLINRAQGHAVGVGAGIDVFGFSANMNYQYTYKLLNIKTKIAYIPQGLFYVPNNSYVNDCFLGIHTKEGKRVLLSINTGVTFLFIGSRMDSEISSQANPIQNFNLALCITPQHRITMDLSMSPYRSTIISKYGGTKHNGLRLTFEIGYSYRFKQKGEAKKEQVSQ
ncbi:MAG: hypothetical protein V4580_00095 [Bacteroidota bacterium]